MKILIPIDVWQEETNAHLSKDLERILPTTKAHIILAYAMQSQPQIESAAANANAAGLLSTVANGVGMLPAMMNIQSIATTDKYNADLFYSELENKTKKHLDDLAIQLKSSCGSIETVFEHGSPAKMIESVAKEKGADLTIIRGSSAGLLESVFLGNTVSQIIKHSHNAILVLRAGVVETALKKVIVALDGSDKSKDALHRFCNFYQAMKDDVEVILTHIVSIPGSWRFIAPIEFVAALEDNLDMAGKAILAEGESILLENGWKPKKMPVPMVVRTGDPATELDRLAAETGAGLIVLGAQGKSAVQSFLLGSVSEALATKSGFPILVFK